MVISLLVGIERSWRPNRTTPVNVEKRGFSEANRVIESREIGPEVQWKGCVRYEALYLFVFRKHYPGDLSGSLPSHPF